MLSVKVRNEKDAKEFLNRFEKSIRKSKADVIVLKISPTYLDLGVNGIEFIVSYNIDENKVDCYLYSEFDFNFNVVTAFSIVAKSFIAAEKFIEFDVSGMSKDKIFENLGIIFDELTFKKYDSEDIKKLKVDFTGVVINPFLLSVKVKKSISEYDYSISIPIDIFYDENDSKIRLSIDERFHNGLFNDGLVEDSSVKSMFEYLKAEIYVWFGGAK